MKKPGFVSDALEAPSGKVFFLLGHCSLARCHVCSLPRLLAAALAVFAAALTVLALSRLESKLSAGSRSNSPLGRRAPRSDSPLGRLAPRSDSPLGRLL